MQDDRQYRARKVLLDNILSALSTHAFSEADTRFIPALLVAKIEALEKQVNDLKPRKKDIFERLSQLSALITGGAIAGVGTLATIFYNSSE